MIKTTSQDLEIHAINFTFLCTNADAKPKSSEPERAFWHPVLAPCLMFNICVLHLCQTVNRLLRMAKTAHEKHIYKSQAAT